jgi:hypothetical protein
LWMERITVCSRVARYSATSAVISVMFYRSFPPDVYFALQYQELVSRSQDNSISPLHAGVHTVQMLKCFCLVCYLGVPKLQLRYSYKLPFPYVAKVGSISS